MTQVNGTANGFHVDNGAAHGRGATGPSVVVVIVTMPDHAGHPLEALLEPLQGGATGYVLNAAANREAIAAVQRFLSGGSVVQPPPAAQPFRQLANGVRDAEIEAALTSRERDVLRLLAAGKTNRAIARDLLLSVGTVKGHVQHLLAKLGVSDRTQAAVRGLQMGLLHPGQT